MLLTRWYYGSALPNTYYLKMTGYPTSLRIESGLARSWAFLEALGPLSLLIAAAGLALGGSKARILAGVLACQIAYSTYVGGDAWEWYGGANRYITVAMPLFMILFAIGLDGCARGLAYLIRDETKHPMAGWATAAILCALTVIGIALHDPLSLHRLKPRDLLMLAPPQQREQKYYLTVARDLDSYADRDATIAVVWAGITPYFDNRNAIDLLGKNDPTIAHLPMHIDRRLGFYPGHLKWDYDYSIGTLKPDVIVELWRVTDRNLCI